MILYSFSITRLVRLSESFERREWYPGHSVMTWSSVSRIGVSKKGSSSKKRMTSVSEEQQKRHVFNAVLYRSLVYRPFSTLRS